jgi:predicted DNA-binding ribbon-helix-helix protein
MTRGLQTRLVSFSGGRITTVALGSDYWDMIDEIKEWEKTTLNLIVEKTDKVRGKRSRANALRIYVLPGALSMRHKHSWRPFSAKTTPNSSGRKIIDALRLLAEAACQSNYKVRPQYLASRGSQYREQEKLNGDNTSLPIAISVFSGLAKDMIDVERA